MPVLQEYDPSKTHNSAGIHRIDVYPRRSGVARMLGV